MKIKFAAILISVISVARLLLPAAEDRVHRSLKCPTCSTNLVSVPLLIGFPTKEMAREEALGRALLGGCIGQPSNPEKASVCLKCRKLKTEQMKYWQDLPKSFGKDAEKSDQSKKSNKRAG